MSTEDSSASSPRAPTPELAAVLMKHGLDPTRQWVVHILHWRQISITVKFAASTPTLRELHTLRQLVPQFRDKSLAAFRKEVGDMSSLYIGTYDWRRVDPEFIRYRKEHGLPPIGEQWVEQCRAAGFGIVTEEKTSTSYTLMDETPPQIAEQMCIARSARKLTPEAIREAVASMRPVCEELIRAGVAVEHYE